MIVIEHKSKVVGFLQLLKKKSQTIVIDLIAVRNKYRGKGFAKSMVYFAYRNCFRKTKEIEVGTQISNVGSIDFYTKLGFRVVGSSYVLHMHQ